MSQTRWMSLAIDGWLLAAEATFVIWLRMGRLALGGGAASTEAQLMVSEKIEAAMAWQVRAMTGGLGANPHIAASRTIAHYGRAVRANRRRLTR